MYFILPSQIQPCGEDRICWDNSMPNHFPDIALIFILSCSWLQALLNRTIDDYTKAGHDCQSSSLEIRLIQSQDYIRNPDIKFKAEKYE